MSWIVDAGVIAGALAAVFALVNLTTGWNAPAWLFNRLVREPAKEAVRHVVRDEVVPLLELQSSRLDEALAEMRPNSGKSFYDRIDKQFDRIDSRFGAIEERMSALEAAGRSRGE